MRVRQQLLEGRGARHRPPNCTAAAERATASVPQLLRKGAKPRRRPVPSYLRCRTCRRLLPLRATRAGRVDPRMCTTSDSVTCTYGRKARSGSKQAAVSGNSRSGGMQPLSRPAKAAAKAARRQEHIPEESCLHRLAELTTPGGGAISVLQGSSSDATLAATCVSASFSVT